MPHRLDAKRTLGSTGVDVPVIGFGTAPLGKPDFPRETALECLHHAIDSGITYLDTSPDYGSEPVVGEVMRTRRDEVFLATKVNRRSDDGVLDEVQESLDRLQTDHVDLIQVHAVNAWADLEQALAPDGAVRALEQARERGMVRFIGITGHARPDILAQALRRYRFDAVLVALGAPDRLVSAPETSLLPEACERGAGVIAMKVYAHGCLQRRDLALRYSLGLPGVSLAIVGMSAPNHIDEIVLSASALQPLSDAEQDQLLLEARRLVETDADESKQGKSSLFWLHDTAVMGWRAKDEPCAVDY